MKVVSVPHSGTRSLCRHLNPTAESFDFWHWGIHDSDISAYEGDIAIPIRNPIDIAISWDARYQTDGGHTAEHLIAALNAMFHTIENRGRLERMGRVTLWQIEKIGLDESSRGPESPVRETRSSPRVDSIREWMQGHMDFYLNMYDPEDL